MEAIGKKTDKRERGKQGDGKKDTGEAGGRGEKRKQRPREGEKN